MAALAYAVPPLSGFIAFLRGGAARVRFHGLQSVALGFVWPVTLYAGALLGPRVTQLVFAMMALVWLFFLVASALGRDPRLPLIGGWLEAAANAPTDEPRNTSGTS